MALANIFREPRREITESVIGVVITGTLVWLDYTFALWFYRIMLCPVPIGMFLGLVLFFAIPASLYGILVFTHFVGELICDTLSDAGLELRPKQRR